VTTVVDMPLNSFPTTTTKETFALKLAATKVAPQSSSLLLYSSSHASRVRVLGEAVRRCCILGWTRPSECEK
jgi:dihydroorotase-like cyclic amidohydrolase